MAFSLLSHSRIGQALRSRSGDRSNRRSVANRLSKSRAGRMAFEPLEARQLLSINTVDAEIFVNTAFQSGDQDDVAISIQPLTNNGTTATAAANAVVVWETALEDGSGDGIRARRYNPSTNLANPTLGVILSPTTTTTGDQSNPAVAMRSNGEFIIVWQGNGAGDPDGIFLRRYNSAGTAIGTPGNTELRVNSTTAGVQSNPQIAVDNSDGSYIIVWESEVPGAGKEIRGIHVTATTTTTTSLGSEFAVNVGTTGDQTNPVVAVDGDGDFVVAWESDSTGTDKDIIARKFNNSVFPNELVGEFLVAGGAGNQALPAISMDEAGRFIVAWTAPGAAVGDGGDIFARRYADLNAAPEGDAFLVNSITTGVQTRPSVALHRPPNLAQPVTERGFIVTWDGPEAPGLGDGVWARGYTADNTPRGPETRVHPARANNQQAPAIGMDSTGRGMIVFEGLGGTDPTGLGVYAQRYTRLNNPPVAQSVTINIQEDSDPRFNTANFINLADYVTEADGDPLTFSNIVSPQTVPRNGILQVNTAVPGATTTSGNWIYTPNVDFVGLDRFTFTASDGVVSNQGIITINVTPVNDPPALVRSGMVQSASNANPVLITGPTVPTSPAQINHNLTTGQRIYVEGLMLSQPLSGASADAVTGEIVFTTPTVHGLANGDRLTIAGATGTGAFDAATGTANGPHVVTVLSTTQFRLLGTTHSGSYNNNSGRLERLSPANGYRTVGTVNAGNNTFQLAGVNGLTGVTGAVVTHIANTGKWELAPLNGLVGGATNATPITITNFAPTATGSAAAPHGLSSGQIVTITGVTGNAGANGTFRIGNAAGNTFQLFHLATGDPVIGTGVYNGGGQWTAVDSNKITGVSGVGTSPITITSNGHGLTTGERVTISDVRVGATITAVNDADQNQQTLITANGHGLTSGQQVTINNVWKGANIAASNNSFSDALRLDTGDAHGLQDGDMIVVQGLTGLNASANNTAENPHWYVQTTTTVDLLFLYRDPALTQGVTGGGVLGAAGTWRALAEINNDHPNRTNPPTWTVRVVSNNQFEVHEAKADVPISAGANSGGQIRLTSNDHDIDADANQGQVTVTGVQTGGVITTITTHSATQGVVVTSNAHGLQNGDAVQILGAAGGTYTNANGIRYVGQVAANTFRLYTSPPINGVFSAASRVQGTGTYTASSAAWRPGTVDPVTMAFTPVTGSNANGTFLTDGIDANVFQLLGSVAGGPYLTSNTHLALFGLPPAGWTGLSNIQLSSVNAVTAVFIASGTVAFHPAPTTWSAPSAANGTYNVTVTSPTQFTIGATSNGPFLANTDAQGVLLSEFTRGVSETLPQGTASHTIFLQNIVPGPANELDQTIASVTAVSDNPTFIPNPTVSYPANGDPTQASFTVMPAAGPGTANITVTITDSLGASRVETVTVIVNNTPTLQNPVNITVLEESTTFIELTGITAGHGTETGQQLVVRAVSLNPATNVPTQTIISDPRVTYIQGSPTALMSIIANPNQFGQVKIRVFVEDNSGGNNNVIFRDFLVTVIGQADTPFVTDVVTTPNAESPPIIITRTGTDTLSFRIQNIFGGSLDLNNSNVEVADGAWITFGQGAAGLQFTPFPNSVHPGSFEIVASTRIATDPLVETGIDPAAAPAVAHIYIANPQPITTPSGTGSQVNTAGINFQSTATATDADGGYVVVFTGQNSPAGTQSQLLMRRYRADGLALGNPDIIDTSTNPQFDFDPAIAMGPSGEFVIVWNDDNAIGGNGTDIVGRRYDALGTPLGNVFLVNTFITGTQADPDVALDLEGNFVVSWTSANQGTTGIFDDGNSSNGVYAQRFDFNNEKVGREILVNTLTAGNQQASSVSMDGEGNFIVAWESSGQATAAPMINDSAGYSVRAQRYDKAGNRMGVREIQSIQFPATVLVTGTDYTLSLGTKTVELTFFGGNAAQLAANYPANVAALQGALDVLAPGAKVLQSTADDARFSTSLVANYGSRGLVYTLPDGGGFDHGLYFTSGNQADWPLMASQGLGNFAALTHAQIQPNQGSPTFNNTTQTGDRHATDEIQRITLTGGVEGSSSVSITIPGLPAVVTPMSTDPTLMAELMQAGLDQRLPGDVQVVEHRGAIIALSTGSPVQVTGRTHGLVTGDRVMFTDVLVGNRVTAVSGNGVSPVQFTSLTNHGLVDGERVWISGVKGNTAANGAWFAKPHATNLAIFQIYQDEALTIPVVGNGAWVTNTGRWDKSSSINGKVWSVNFVDANIFDLDFDVANFNPSDGLGGSVWHARSGEWKLVANSAGVPKRHFDIGFSGTVGLQNIPNLTVSLAAGGTGSAIARTDPRPGTPSEMVLNSTTAGDQRRPSVAMDLDGDFVVAFEEGALNAREVMARLFNRAGVVTQTTPTNDNRNQFQVNPPAVENPIFAGDQTIPNVAMLPDGGFIVSFYNHPDPLGSLSAGIFARPYDSTGKPENVVRLIPTDAFNPLPGFPASYGFSADATGKVSASILTFDGAVSNVLTRTVPLDLPSTVPLFNRAGTITGAANVVEVDPDDPMMMVETEVRISSASHGLQNGDIITISGILVIVTTPEGDVEEPSATANGRFAVALDDEDNFFLRDTATGNAVLLDGPYAGGGRWILVPVTTQGAPGMSQIVISQPDHGLQDGDQVVVAGVRVGAQITGATGIGQSPIRITSPGHALVTGNTIVVTGVQGNTNANGLNRVVTVIDDNTFDLNGTVPNGAYIAGTGQWTRPVIGPESVVVNANDRWVITVIDADRFSLDGSQGNLNTEGEFMPYIGGAYSTVISEEITNVSNADVTVTITSAGHGLAVGDAVIIVGVLGNRAANGTFVVGAVPTSDTFTLVDPVTGSSVVGNGPFTLGPVNTPLPRWSKPFETTAPTVAGVYLANILPGLEPSLRVDQQPVSDGEAIQRGVRRLVIAFSESMSNFLSANSVENVQNWELFRNTAVGGPLTQTVSHLIDSIDYGFNALTGRFEAVVNFTTQGPQGLPQGDFLLRATDAITDLAGNPLDGDGDGVPGGDFELRFSTLGTLADGPESQVNVFFGQDQINPSVARDAQGNYVVVWETETSLLDPSGSGIIGRRYLADGTALGANEVQRLNFSWPGSAPTNDLSFFDLKFGDRDPVRVFYSSVLATLAARIRAALNSFDIPVTVQVVNVGTPARPQATITYGGLGIDRPQVVVTQTSTLPEFEVTPSTLTEGGANSEFLVNNATTGSQVNPSVSMADDGTFVVVWEGDSGLVAEPNGIFGRRFSAAGVPLAVQFQVNSTSPNIQAEPSVDMAGDGSFVVVWSGAGLGAAGIADDDTNGIWMRRYNAAGVVQAAEALVNVAVITPAGIDRTGIQEDPDVVIGDDGTIMVVWESPDFQVPITNVIPGGTSESAIQITSPNHGLMTGQQIFISGVEGTPEANGLQTVTLNPTNPLNQFVISTNGGSGPYVAGTGEWTIPGTGTGIFQRRFTAAGVAIGGQVRVNTTVAGEQVNPVVEADNSGRFVVAWNSFGQDGDDQGVYAQVYRTDANGSLGGLKVGVTNEVQDVRFINNTPPNNSVFRLTYNGPFGQPAMNLQTADITYSTNASVTQERIREAFAAIGVPVSVGAIPFAPEPNVSYRITFLNEGVNVLPISVATFANTVTTIFEGGSGGGFEFQVNETTAGPQSNPEIAMDRDGDVVFGWESGGNIYARRFSILGGVQSSEFVVNTTTAGVQSNHALAVNPDGDLVVVWQGPNVGGQDNEILLQQFMADTTPPVLPPAEANGPYTVNEGSTVGVVLSSAGSAAGVGATYTWEFDLDGDGQFDDLTLTGASPTFVPTGIDGTSSTMEVKVRLRVDFNDGTNYDEAVIDVLNVAPTAPAIGGTLNVPEGGSTGLTGSGSTDPAGPLDPLTYQWDLDGDGIFGETGANATRGNELGTAVTFSAAGLDGFAGATFNVSLRVIDGDGGTSTVVTQAISITNVEPSAAFLNEPYQVDEGGSLVVSATASDPGGAGDPLTYEWDFDNDGAFDDATGAAPTFSAAALDGFAGATQTIRLRVSDGEGVGTIIMTTVAINNVAPQNVSAGGPYDVVEGTSTMLSGSATDVAADLPLTFDWDLDRSGTFDPGELNLGPNPTFSAAGLTAGQQVFVQMRVSDESTSVTSTATINVIGAAQPQIIDDQDPGYVDSFNGWSHFGGGYLGDNSVASDESAPGEEFSTWTFNITQPGLYRVSATWPDFYGDIIAVNSPFSVIDGGVSRGTVLVNQAVAPNPNVTVGGVNFQNLGDFNLANSTLTVRLSTQGATKANGLPGFVIADGVRIERIGDLPLGPEVQVTEGFNDVPDGTGSSSFGTTVQNSPVLRTYTISNQGQGTLNLAGIGVPAGSGFSMATPPGDTSLATGESTTFTVRMDAQTPGNYVTGIGFGNNDTTGDEGFYSFTISGQVTGRVIDDTFENTAEFSRVGTPFAWGDASSPDAFGFENDYRLASNYAGTNTATWTFNVTPGRYKVASTWFEGAFGGGVGGFYTEFAEYTVLEGAVPRGEATLNQQLASQDFFEQGVGWKDFGGVYNITGNTLSVLLNAQGAVDGKLAIADAIRLERIGDLLAGPEVGVSEGGLNYIQDAGTASFVTDMNRPVTKTFTIANEGTTALTLGALSAMPAGFTLVPGSPLPASLAPGQSASFQVRLDAVLPGPYGGVISFATNDAAPEDVFEINLSGTVSNKQILDDGDPGHTKTLETSTGNAGGFYGTDPVFASDFTYTHALFNNQPSESIYTFTVTPGQYSVAATWLEAGNWAPNARYRVFDGPTQVGGEFRLDQRSAPDDFSDAGIAGPGFNGMWERVGGTGQLFSITSNTLTVILDNVGVTDGYIIGDAMRIQYEGALLLDVPVNAMGGASLLTQAEADALATSALARWAMAGLDQISLDRLAGIDVQVVDLGGSQLGLAMNGTIYIDQDAAGHGWFVDLTPDQDEEFDLVDGQLRATSDAARNRADLLSVLIHELGHELGLGHSHDGDDEDGLDAMAETIALGARRLPTPELLDHIFGEE